MKLTIDFKNKTIEVLELTNLADLLENLITILPDWKSYSIRSTQNYYWYTTYQDQLPTDNSGDWMFKTTSDLG